MCFGSALRNLQTGGFAKDRRKRQRSQIDKSQRLALTERGRSRNLEANRNSRANARPGRRSVAESGSAPGSCRAGLRAHPKTRAPRMPPGDGRRTFALPNLTVLDQAAPLRGAGSGAPRAGLCALGRPPGTPAPSQPMRHHRSDGPIGIQGQCGIRAAFLALHCPAPSRRV
jgi:hypothetical protein